MRFTHTIVPAVALVALSLAALPAGAQQRRPSGTRGGGDQSAPRASEPRQRATPRAAPRQSQQGAAVQQQRSYARAPRSDDRPAVQRQAQPRASVQQQRPYAQQPRSGAQQQPSYSQTPRSGAPQQPSYSQVPRPGAPQQQTYTQRAVPRPGPAPRGDNNGGYDNSRGYNNSRGYDGGRAYGNRAPVYGNNNAYGYRGNAGRGAYVAPRRTYGYGYPSRYGYGYGYRPYYYPRPYYAFRPRLSLGFGLWIGFPTAYPYYSYGYTNLAYGYPVSRFGLAAGTAYGGISFEVDPYDAAVFIDGEYAGVVGDFGPNAQPLTLRAGNYRVEIQANGYEPVMFEVNVVPGQVIPYRGSLRYY